MNDEHAEKIKGLRDWVLVGLTYRVDARTALVTFGHWEGKKRSVILSGTVQLNVSGTPDDSGEALVVNARLEEIHDGGKAALGELGHDFRDSNGGVASYPGTHLIRVFFEGDICVEAICQNLEVTEEEQVVRRQTRS